MSTSGTTIFKIPNGPPSGETEPGRRRETPTLPPLGGPWSIKLKWKIPYRLYNKHKNNMETLQQEVQIAIQKFQEQGREVVQAEFQQELDGLKHELVSKNKRLELLEQENTKLKKGYEHLNDKLGGLVTDIISKFISATLSITDEKGLPLPLDSAEEEERSRQEAESDLEQSRFDDDDKGLETKEPKLHSIKDRIKHMNHDPQNFTNQRLAVIGKKMADYYRKAHNDADPSKREEKINEKHTSLVCVYSENDWEYMDYLIKTSLDIQ